MTEKPKAVMTEEQQAELKHLEERIRKGELKGIRHRWESGRYLLALRGGEKKLPAGVRNFMSETLKVSESEVSARIKFAEVCHDEQAFSDVVRDHRSWHAITHKALIETPRQKAEPAPSVNDVRGDAETEDDLDDTDDIDDVEDTACPPETSPLYGVLAILEALAPANISDDEVVLLGEIIRLAHRQVDAAGQLRSIKAA